jgi:hypothetical protein
MAWHWTEKRLDIVGYLECQGYEVGEGVEGWYISWQVSYERGIPYCGWEELSGSSEREDRLGRVLEYQRYCSWWKVEWEKRISVPGSMSGEGVKGRQGSQSI